MHSHHEIEGQHESNASKLVVNISKLINEAEAKEGKNVKKRKAESLVESTPKKMIKSAPVETRSLVNQIISDLARCKEEETALQDKLKALEDRQKALGVDFNYCIDVFSARARIILPFVPDLNVPDAPVMDTSQKRNLQARSFMPQPHLIQRIFEIESNIVALEEPEQALRNQIKEVSKKIKRFEKELSLSKQIHVYSTHNPNPFVQFQTVRTSNNLSSQPSEELQEGVRPNLASF
jgi:hypothetical protein